MISNINLFLALFKSKILSEIKLKPTSRLVLCCLLSHLNTETGALYPAVETIASECGCDKKQAIIAIQDLESKEIIKITQGKYKGKIKNFYSFHESFINLVIGGKIPPMQNNNGGILPPSQVAKNPTIGVKKPPKHDNNKLLNMKENFLKNLTPFQEDFRDVFEQLMPEEIQIYKMKKGYEREEWLLGRRKDFARQIRLFEQKKQQEEDFAKAREQRLSIEEIRALMPEKQRKRAEINEKIKKTKINI